MYKYAEVYMQLQYDTAIVTFKKKDNTVRVMLCTRNAKTAVLVMEDINKALGLLSGHDKRCSISNGNLATYDLVIGECRSFNVDRVLEIVYLGQIMTSEELDEAFKAFKEYEQSIKDVYNAETGIEQLIALENRRIEGKLAQEELEKAESVENQAGVVKCESMDMFKKLIQSDKDIEAMVKNTAKDIAKSKKE